MNTKRLVINADDLGLAESVNRGIIESIATGVVTSTSLLVNMPACDDAMTRLRECLSDRRFPAPSVGLHFNIVAGRPMGVCPTLLQGPHGVHSLSALAWRAFTRRLDERDVERELEAQLDRARRLLEPLGLRVTHIDSHRHTHCLPGIFGVVLRTARRHGITHVRHPYEMHHLIPRRPRAFLASGFLRAVTARHSPLDAVRFAGIGAMNSPTFALDIAALLDALPEGTTELMVHPGYDSPELAAIDSYREPRERELRALTSPALRDRILERGIELTSFGARAPTESEATAPIPAAS